MTEQDHEEESVQRDRREQRMMWIFSGAIILLICGAMGANVLYHRANPPPADTNTDISSQSRTTPADK